MKVQFIERGVNWHVPAFPLPAPPYCLLQMLLQAMMILFRGAYSGSHLNSWKQLAWAMHHAIAEEILAKILGGFAFLYGLMTPNAFPFGLPDEGCILTHRRNR